MAEADGDKQHEATQHRRDKAREEGQIARSQDLVSAVLLLVGLLALQYWGVDLANYFGRLFREQLGGEAWLSIDRDTTVERWMHFTAEAAWAIVPLLGVLFLAGIAANLGQSGLLFLPEKIQPDISHLNLLQNAQRMFSISSAVRLGFGLFKVAIVCGVGAMSLWNERLRLMSLADLETGQTAAYLASVTLSACLNIAIALVILALFDYGYQYWKFEQDLRMTNQEMRDEMKEQQGNPQILAKRRQLHREMAKNKLATTVPKADAIVSNPTELAIAIQYDLDTMAAPVVIAKGAGVLAQQIRRLGLQHGIPIVERKELARALYQDVEVGKPVPVDQYAAVAEVLRYVYQLKGKKLPTLKSA